MTGAADPCEINVIEELIFAPVIDHIRAVASSKQAACTLEEVNLVKTHQGDASRRSYSRGCADRIESVVVGHVSNFNINSHCNQLRGVSVRLSRSASVDYRWGRGCQGHHDLLLVLL
jgi:hypothetical protein